MNNKAQFLTGILIVLAVALVAGGGYYLYEQQASLEYVSGVTVTNFVQNPDAKTASFTLNFNLKSTQNTATYPYYMIQSYLEPTDGTISQAIATISGTTFAYPTTVSKSYTISGTTYEKYCGKTLNLKSYHRLCSTWTGTNPSDCITDAPGSSWATQIKFNCPTLPCSLSNPAACTHVGEMCMDSRTLCADAFIYNSDYYCDIDDESSCSSEEVCSDDQCKLTCATSGQSCGTNGVDCCNGVICDIYGINGATATYKCYSCTKDSDCSASYTCVSGICKVKTQTCSDPEKTYYAKGEVTFSGSSNGVIYDTCTSTQILSEAVCNTANTGTTVKYNCSSEGKVCSDGACISPCPIGQAMCGDGVCRPSCSCTAAYSAYSCSKTLTNSYRRNQTNADCSVSTIDYYCPSGGTKYIDGKIECSNNVCLPVCAAGYTRCSDNTCKVSCNVCSIVNNQYCEHVGARCMDSNTLCNDAFIYNNNYYCDTSNSFPCSYGCANGQCTGQPPVCNGNGVCEGQETVENCPNDCKQITDCGNGICESPDETSDSCPEDCPIPPVCGDGICESAKGETTTTCLSDCPIPPVCGNGVCESGETTASCVSDCPNPPACGDGKCEGSETVLTCPNDCPCVGTSCQICNNNDKCEANETIANCPNDCKEIPPDETTIIIIVVTAIIVLVGVAYIVSLKSGKKKRR